MLGSPHTVLGSHPPCQALGSTAPWNSDCQEQRWQLFGCSQCQHRLLQAGEALPAQAGLELCSASACRALAVRASGFTGAWGRILQVLSAIWHAQRSLFPHTSSSEVSTFEVLLLKEKYCRYNRLNFVIKSERLGANTAPFKAASGIQLLFKTSGEK